LAQGCCELDLLSSPPTSCAAAMKLAALILSAAVLANATELTKETWDAAVAGKSVFVKFQAPW